MAQSSQFLDKGHRVQMNHNLQLVNSWILEGRDGLDAHFIAK